MSYDPNKPYVLMRVLEPNYPSKTGYYSVFYHSSRPFRGEPTYVSQVDESMSRAEYAARRVEPDQDWEVYVAYRSTQSMACWEMRRRDSIPSGWEQGVVS